MSGIRPENLEPEIFDRSLAAQVLFREEPDEEEEEDEEDEQDEDNQEDNDEGYSE